MSEGDFWESIRRALGGWKALVIVAIASSAVTVALGRIWRAPEMAERALAEASLNDARITEMESAIHRLDTTVRIYLCTREDVSRQARVRLECGDFDL